MTTTTRRRGLCRSGSTVTGYAYRSPDAEVRAAAADNGTVTIEGYAVVWNRYSSNLGGYVEQIDPAAFDPMLGVHAVGYALIGGLATAFGPLLGAAFDLGLLEASRLFGGWRMVVFGGLVALFLRWRPRGLLDEAMVHRIARWTWRLPAGRATPTASHRY